MIVRRHHAYLLFFTSLSCALPCPAVEGRREDLDRLRTQIRDTVAEKKRLQEDADKARNKLRQQELALAEAGKRLAEIRAAMTAKQALLETLTAQRSRDVQALDTERERLAAILRAHYAAGREDTLKLALSQDDPQRLSRLLSYHDILARARFAQVTAAGSTLHTTVLLAENTQLETERLQYLETEQNRLIDTVTKLRAARSQTLAALDTEISAREDALDDLRANKRALEQLLYSLPAGGGPRSTPAGGGSGLATLKGRLTWPAPGPITRKFGDTASADSELPLDGVLIAAAAGHDVHAIHAGLVRFADWFQGFGLLLIIDHGEGYISLYGHNQSLNKKVGETVQTGAVVAAVGDSGGRRESGLYFGIRHNGKPRDPALWCR